MYSSFITSFCIISIVWCTVSYLLNLLACIYLCDAIDGAPYEDKQEQGFEDPDQQQHFEEGKWTLDHACCPIITNYSHLLYMQCMSI